MPALKAGFDLYRLMSDCAAILLDDYGREQESVVLSAGNVFMVNSEAGVVSEHPETEYHGISAEGKRFRVEAALLAKKSVPLEESGRK